MCCFSKAALSFKDSTALCCTITSGHTWLVSYSYYITCPWPHFISKRKPPSSHCPPLPARFLFRHLPQLQFVNRSSTTEISCFLWRHYPRLARASHSVKEHSRRGGSALIYLFCFALKRVPASSGCSEPNTTAPTARNPPSDKRGDTAAQLPLCFLEYVAKRRDIAPYCSSQISVGKWLQDWKLPAAFFFFIKRLTEVTLMWLPCHPLCCNPCCRSVLQEIQVSVSGQISSEDIWVYTRVKVFVLNFIW